MDDGALEQCRNRLTRLLDPSGPERTRVRTVSRSYRASDGAARAAELLVELGRTGRPLRPAPRVFDWDAASLRVLRGALMQATFVESAEGAQAGRALEAQRPHAADPQ
jgi:hypothetical protein